MRTQCAIVGGGIAGLQAAIQLGRYEADVIVFDAGYGRSTLCRQYRNLLGWPDGVSGEQLRNLGRTQAEALGVKFVERKIERAEKKDDVFRLFGQAGEAETVCEADVVLLATGLLDRFPELPGLVPCLGVTVYVCPDCDGYEIRGKRTVVLGAGDTGAQMALLLRERTNEMVYIDHERKPISEENKRLLAEAGILHIGGPAERVVTNGDGRLEAVILADGRAVPAERGFIAFGGNRIQSGLAHQLGAERHENGHILTDPRTKMTSVHGLWAAGDVGVHSEQVAIAMGEGSQAAIWMHKMITGRMPATV